MKKRHLGLLIAVLLVVTVSLGGCFALLNTVLDNLNTVFTLLDPSVEEGDIPENAVYGSDDDLAVGFSAGN